ncbi:MAG: flippase-like domain-containing protein [Elusimicrobia bacterium]|nr:flippase-like domain-containing protein [Elusimicrobiota bacterium]
MNKQPFTFSLKIETLLGIGGIILLGWMIHKIGLPLLIENLKNFGLLPMVFLILFYTLAQIFFCLAWFVILKNINTKAGFWETFLVYAAGDALNMTVPSGNLAGEPVKVMLFKDKIPSTQMISSVTIYKFWDFISLTLFLLAGWLFHFFFYSLPLSWNIAAGIMIFGMTLVSLLLFVLQKKGLYLPTGKWLSKIALLESWIVGKLESAHLIDQDIRNFYIVHPIKFFQSILFNFLAWFGGVIEIMLFMKFLGLETSFQAAFTIETFSLFINNLAFFVPARLGVGEGGRVLLFITLGYPPSSGMSYGIIRRIRETVWIGFGLGVLLIRKRKLKPEHSQNTG